MSDRQLSRAQRALLGLMSIEEATVNCVPSYGPAKALVARGYAEWTEATFPRLRSTEAGRAALKEKTDAE